MVTPSLSHPLIEGVSSTKDPLFKLHKKDDKERTALLSCTSCPKPKVAHLLRETHQFAAAGHTVMAPEFLFCVYVLRVGVLMFFLDTSLLFLHGCVSYVT